jgi:hypothetical protein
VHGPEPTDDPPQFSNGCVGPYGGRLLPICCPDGLSLTFGENRCSHLIDGSKTLRWVRQFAGGLRALADWLTTKDPSSQRRDRPSIVS